MSSIAKVATVSNSNRQRACPAEWVLAREFTVSSIDRATGEGRRNTWFRDPPHTPAYTDILRLHTLARGEVTPWTAFRALRSTRLASMRFRLWRAVLCPASACSTPVSGPEPDRVWRRLHPLNRCTAWETWYGSDQAFRPYLSSLLPCPRAPGNASKGRNKKEDKNRYKGRRKKWNKNLPLDDEHDHGDLRGVRRRVASRRPAGAPLARSPGRSKTPLRGTANRCSRKRTASGGGSPWKKRATPPLASRRISVPSSMTSSISSGRHSLGSARLMARPGVRSQASPFHERPRPGIGSGEGTA